jgi:hypothetical protein
VTTASPPGCHPAVDRPPSYVTEHTQFRARRRTFVCLGNDYPPTSRPNTARESGDAFPAPPTQSSQRARPLRLPPHQSPGSGPHVPAGEPPPPGAFRSRRRQVPHPPQGSRRLRQPTPQGDRLCCARASGLGDLSGCRYDGGHFLLLLVIESGYGHGQGCEDNQADS